MTRKKVRLSGRFFNAIYCLLLFLPRTNITYVHWRKIRDLLVIVLVSRVPECPFKFMATVISCGAQRPSSSSSSHTWMIAKTKDKGRNHEPKLTLSKCGGRIGGPLMPLLMEDRTWSVGFSCVHESDCRRSSSLALVDAARSD